VSDTSDDVPCDAHEELMEATYRALCDHGYADLTMQDIADEADRSKSLLHYHYDTKERLFVAFLDYLLSRFEAHVAESDGAPSARERLLALVDLLLVGSEEEARLHQALLELRSQAPYNDAYREQMRENKRALQQAIADVVAAGVESGEFTDAHPESTARFVLAALDGARSAHVTLDDERDTDAVREGIRRFVVDELTR
jgi:AcrR family transcriptional regulator